MRGLSAIEWLRFAPLLALALFACGDEDRRPEPEQPSAEELPTAAFISPSPTPAMRPPPSLTLEPRPPDTVWLFDVRSGGRTTLIETPGQSVLRLRFGPGDTVLADTLVVDRAAGNRIEEVRLRYDGSVVSRGPISPPATGDCAHSTNGAVVQGRTYQGVSCGPISPDRRWMTYQVDAGTAQVVPPSATNPNGYSVPVWDQWVVELTTDKRQLLQAGLRHCGGCDGRFGPAWSPSGRLLYFSEWLGNGSTFISDLSTGTTRELFSGSTDILVEPDWSPRSDLLVYRTTAGLTVLEDFTSGTGKELPELAWPARFDTSGAYLYSPAWDNDSRVAGGETRIYEVRLGQVVATLAGQPRGDSLFMPVAPVRGEGGSFTAVLEGAANCGGVAVYRRTTSVACISGGSGALLSPDSRMVALSRLTHGAGPGPAWQLSEYEILLADVATGSIKVLSGGALSAVMPPELIWNAAGTLLLARWPFGGYGP
jgi:hypothetical protein